MRTRMRMNTPQWRCIGIAALSMALGVALSGCAGKSPQGYGVADQSAAAQAQQQMEQAERATQIDPQQTYLSLIVQMQQANQWYASLAHTDAFEQQYGRNTKVGLLRADALRNTGQSDASQALYESLLKDPDHGMQARARRGLGLLAAGKGQYAEAVVQLERARQLSPIDADVLSDLAFAHMLDGRLDAAALPIQQAAQLAPTNARVQLNLALFWLASGAREQAAQLLSRLRKPQSKNSPALIDEQSVQTLQTQLMAVQEAVRARMSAAAASTTTPTTTSVESPVASPVASPTTTQ